jgi:beta-lactamase regulating signal transducer with metallopeptidase domain
MNVGIESNLDPRFAAVWLDALLKSFVVLAFAAGLCVVWRRASAATRHLIWFFGLMGLLLLPLLPFVLPTTPRPLWTVSGGHVSGNEIALSLQLGPAKPVLAVAEPVPAGQSPAAVPHASGRRLFQAHMSRSWLAIGFGVWALGALAMLLYPVVGRFQLLRMEANAEVLATSEWAALLTEASQMLNLRRRVVLLQSRASVMPLTWGWLEPKVLMPAEAEQWPAERRRIVLLHELAHVKRRDCLTQSLTRMVCALYWFNPLAWMAARQMRIERERACDDLVLNGGCKASDYAGHLVEIATNFRRAPQAGIAMARSSNLEQRVTAIVDGSRARRLRPAGLVGILICIGAVLFYIGGYKTNAADNDRSSAVSQETLAQLEKFSAEKEAQSKMLAAASGETIVPQFQKYFDAAKKGDFRTITNMFGDFKQHHPQYSHAGDKDWRPAYRTSYWQPMLEIALVYDAFAMSDSKFTQQAARGIIDSIPPGAIYFGGTDPGRGLPTAFSKSQVNADPFYTLSQNPLADGTYDDYLRKMYGKQRRTLVELGRARQADPELSRLDRQLRVAEQKSLSLEISKSADDPARLAADKAVEDLSSNITVALARVQKPLEENEDSAAANAWPADKVIFIPTANDVEACFQDYLQDAKKRLEEKKLRPGEEVKLDASGQVQVTGQIAVQAINARLTKLIFDKNPNREFFVEESFPHDWMYPHLEPNGLIMKINREPLLQLPEDVIQKDEDYWQSRVNEWLGNWLTPETPVETVADFATKVYGRKNLDGFTGDPAFVSDAYAPKMYSKWRSSIANLYTWRLGAGLSELPPEYSPKSDAEKQKLAEAADFAFKQGFAICPFSPEIVFGYVNFLVKQGRKADALAIVHAAVIVDPKNETFRQLENNVSAQANVSPKDSAGETAANDSERLRQLQAMRVQREAAYNRLKTLYEKLKSMNHADLRKALPVALQALPVAVHDDYLTDLLSQYDLAQQKRIDLEHKYTTNHPAMLSALAEVNDLDKKIDERMDKIMLGLDAKLAYDDYYLQSSNKDIEELRATLKNGK